MQQQLVNQQSRDLFNFSGDNDLDTNWRSAQVLSGSDMVPKDYQNKPGNVLIAIQMGLEIGLKPMQSLQNISVINGRPSVWGDAFIAICRNHPKCEYIRETFDEKTMTATCTAKRKDDDEVNIETFDKQDAILAGLWVKKGPWTQYPQRMLKMRARAFCLRDLFPDALKGLSIAEEAQDFSLPVIKQINEAPQELPQSAPLSRVDSLKTKILPQSTLVTEEIEEVEEIKEAEVVIEEENVVKAEIVAEGIPSGLNQQAASALIGRINRCRSFNSLQKLMDHILPFGGTRFADSLRHVYNNKKAALKTT